MIDDFNREGNGPEYISHILNNWAEQQSIELACIQPGNPQQNAYIERYNRTVRYEWFWTYNNERPHMGLGGISPKQKLALHA